MFFGRSKSWRIDTGHSRVIAFFARRMRSTSLRSSLTLGCWGILRSLVQERRDLFEEVFTAGVDHVGVSRAGDVEPAAVGGKASASRRTSAIVTSRSSVP